MAETQTTTYGKRGNPETRRDFLKQVGPAAALAASGVAAVARPALAGDGDTELLGRIVEAQREAEWVLAQGGPDGAYHVDRERYLRFEDDFVNRLEDATPATTAEAFALIGFAIAAERALNCAVPPYGGVWQGAWPRLSSAASRCSAPPEPARRTRGGREVAPFFASCTTK